MTVPRVIVATLLYATACGGGQGDSPDASTSSDAPSSAGLLVSWTANPALPGPFQNDVTVTSAMFRLDRLEVIGDAGSGPLTTKRGVSLQWNKEGTNPAGSPFGSAPSGLYSQVTLRIDGDLIGPSYEILGTVKVGGVTKPFKIEDLGVVTAEVKNYNVTLAPGGDGTLAVRVDLRDSIDGVDFSLVPEENGVLELESGAQIVDFRNHLKDAFKRGP